MATMLNTPVFGKRKYYESLKYTRLSWREITALKRGKQGIDIELKLPENDATQIREKK